MSVSLYFGLPGAGKTTLLAYEAKKAIKSCRYRNIYSNVRLSMFGVTYIDNSCIGKYNLCDCLLLIDEATLFADSRAYKEFDKGKLQYFLEHRHYNCDIMLFTQQWDGVDKKIRVITDRVYYVYKGLFLGHWFTRCYRIPYGIIIPNPKKDQGEKLGDIVQGYCKPNFFVRLLSPWIYRPAYYRYFNSWERPDLPPLPAKYVPYYEISEYGEVISTLYQKRQLQRKRNILLRSIRSTIKTKAAQLLSSIKPTVDRILDFFENLLTKKPRD